ncbi:PBP1A family penicillin-binding protein [Paenibacillus yanchengensis]|uniref:PBP1A family penicillin-binding protein n=1 Tax=Paenibacillus yanchengensis TaxID=2035833 RepID=A0ABW4YJV8_9BACL
MAEQPKRTSNSEQNRSRKSTKKKRKKKMTGMTWFYIFFFSLVIAIVCAIVGYLMIIMNGERILSEHGNKLNFGQTSIIYDINDNEIAKLYDVNENREIVEYADIPEKLKEAVIATEDQRFLEHSGLDFWAIGRAVVKDIVAREAVEGASTITQQLAKNVFLSSEKTLLRKATEASISVALEQKLTKEEILTMYLNRIFFGHRMHGIKNAADFYFDKDLDELELWEMATLAAIPKAPNRFNPLKHPIDSKARRAVVLKLMYDQGYITEQEMNEAKEVEYVPPANIEKKSTEKHSAFVDIVIDEAIEMTKMTEEELRMGGYRIYTTLNPTAQQVVEKEFNNDSNFDSSVDEQKSQAAMVIIDHRTGEIQAVSGGRDYVKKGFNRIYAKRQPGSAFKPISVFGPALETGKYTPNTTLKIDRTCFDNYCPRDRWGAVSVSMSQAMKDSRNLAAVWLLNEIGAKQGMNFSAKLGMELPKEDRNLSLALGGLTVGVSPLQMATAYSIIANDGKTVDPHTIRKIEGPNKYEKEYKAPKQEQLISSQTASYLTDMMLKVVEKGGTGVKAAIDRPVAGKTGTTQHGIAGYKGNGIRDAWFVGYTPEWTAAIWMGYDTPDKDHLLQSNSSQAAALFAKVMGPAMKNVKKSSFKKVEQVVEATPPPVQVSNFKLDFIAEQMTVVLNWDAVKEEGVTYFVYRKQNNEQNYSLYGETAGTELWDTSVMGGNQYSYYVTVYNPNTDVESTRSNVLTVDVTEDEWTETDVPMETDPLEPYPTDFPTELPEETISPTNPPDGGETGELPATEPPVTELPTDPPVTEAPPSELPEPTPDESGIGQPAQTSMPVDIGNNMLNDAVQ